MPKNPCEALKKELDELNKAKAKLEAELNSTNARWADSMSRVMEKQVRDAMPELGTDEFGVEMRDGQVYVTMNDKLLFPSGSAEVNSRGQDVLRKFSAVLQKNPDFKISVEGHTDNVPIKSRQYVDNWDLSASRSLTVIRLLTRDYRVQPERITLVGKAWYTPVASNNTAEGRAKNRRIEFVLKPSATTAAVSPVDEE